MNKEFLRQFWDRAVRAGIDSGESALGSPSLPYDDEAERLLGFVDQMGLVGVQSMDDPLGKEGAAWLLSRYPEELVREVLLGMENYKKLNKKYKSAKLTANNWCRRRLRDGYQQGNVNVPVT